MRLLNVETLQLESFPDARKAPPYAILSHRWQDEEVLFEDLQDDGAREQQLSVARQLEAMQRRLEALELRVGVGVQSTADVRNDSVREAVEGRVDGAALADNAWVDSESALMDNDTAKRRALDPISQPRTMHSEVPRRQRKKGWAKVQGCRLQAQKFGMPYIWIDTCCIDQKSSPELFESINSMMAWYRDAKMCIAYLADVRREWDKGCWDVPAEFESSEWFKVCT